MDGETITDRRRVLAGAALGAAAWVTPSVLSIDAVAAQSGLAGCFRVQYGERQSSIAVTQRLAPVNGSGCIPSSVWNNRPDFPPVPAYPAQVPSDITVEEDVGAGLYRWTLTSPGCVFPETSLGSGTPAAAGRTDNGNQCLGASFEGVGQTVITLPIDPPWGEPYDRVKILVACPATPNPCPDVSLV